jgi:hypothetical protein
MKTALMRMVALLLFAASSTPVFAQGSNPFSDYFQDSTLRIDYYHIGNSSEEIITFDRLLRQGSWAGNPRHLIDPLGFGRYSVAVFDSATNRPIYTKGFDTYFGEYKTTAPAKEGKRRTYHESVLVPFPKRTVRVTIGLRGMNSATSPLWTSFVNPSDYHINIESVRRGDDILKIVNNGDPHDNVDIVIVAEGYTLAEKDKFRKDLERFSEVFFSMEPYKSSKSKFNVNGIFTPSPESGVDEPRQGSYRKTALGASFNSLDSDRYLLVDDNRTLRDVAAQVPYDVMMVMVNSTRYGGGGFYGYYCAFTSDGPWSDYVFQHEFGHTFGGLADEYYTTDVAYEDFYPEGVEPPEPNITRLLDPQQLKWKDLVTPGLTIPTPWGHERYDSLTSVRDSRGEEQGRFIEKLNQGGVSSDSIAKVEELFKTEMRGINDQIVRFMAEHPLRGKIGAFEGGGYLPKGIYRPTVNSIMNQFTPSDRFFYGVNERAIAKVIDYYSK